MIYRLFETVRSKKKESKKEDHLHDNRNQIQVQLLQVSKTSCRWCVSIVTAVSSSDLRLFVIVLGLIDTAQKGISHMCSVQSVHGRTGLEGHRW
jgi:hypothetical protein